MYLPTAESRIQTAVARFISELVADTKRPDKNQNKAGWHRFVSAVGWPVGISLSVSEVEHTRPMNHVDRIIEQESLADNSRW